MFVRLCVPGFQFPRLLRNKTRKKRKFVKMFMFSKQRTFWGPLASGLPDEKWSKLEKLNPYIGVFKTFVVNAEIWQTIFLKSCPLW